MNKDQNKTNQINYKTMMGIFTILVVVMIGGLGFTTYKYYDLKKNFDTRSEAITNLALRKNTKRLEADFVEREKREFVTYTALTELGSLSFTHPKNWHIYLKNDSVNDYEVYFHPRRIRPIDRDSRYALRLNVTDKDYERVLKGYDSLVRKEDITTKVVNVNGSNATLFEGMFNKYIKGSQLVFKLRDKTVIMSTDAEQFKKDFYEIIETITFNR